MSEFIKGRAIGMLEAGMNVSQVAEKIEVDRRTIRRWWTRYQETSTIERKPGSGRPRLGSERDDRHLLRFAINNRWTCMRNIYRQVFDNINRPYSIRTAYRRTLEAGYRSYRPLQRIPLGPQHRRNRLNWCTVQSLRPNDYWKSILWTDESRFKLDFNDGRIRVRRLPTERFLDACIAEHDRYGRGSVMIWGGCWYGGKTSAVLIEGNLNGERYVNEILSPVVVPTLQENNLILQQDNARSHTSRVATSYLREKNVTSITWPARSPDLAPIEHLWDIIQRHLTDNFPVPTSLHDLAQQLLHCWNSISQEDINNLIESFQNRMTECIERQGGHTHY